MLDMFFSILGFIIVISCVICFHEYGHYKVAKLSGVKVLEFSLGFGKILYQKNIDNTLFTLRLVPLGGFIKPFSMQDLSEEEKIKLTEIEKKSAFENTPKTKKFFIVIAGPLFNFLLAFAIYVVFFAIIGFNNNKIIVKDIEKDMIFAEYIKKNDEILKMNDKKIYNSQQVYQMFLSSLLNNELVTLIINRDGKKIKVEIDLEKEQDLNKYLKTRFISFQRTDGDIYIKSINKNSPAEKEGLVIKDMIKEVNGQKLTDIQDITNIIQNSKGEYVFFKVTRNNKDIDIKIKPDINEKNKKYAIGVSFDVPKDKLTTYSRIEFWEGLLYSLDKLWANIKLDLLSIYGLITQKISLQFLSGPLSIATSSGKIIQSTILNFFMFMASISIGIGVFNLLPFPLLDGGTAMQYIIEMARNKEFHKETLLKLQYLGIFGIGFIFMFSFINDLNRIVFT